MTDREFVDEWATRPCLGSIRVGGFPAQCLCRDECASCGARRVQAERNKAADVEIIHGIRAPVMEALIYVDATPDEGYPLRILEAHLTNNMSGVWMGDATSQRMCDVMNQASDERTKLLRGAIAILRGSP